MTAAPDPILAMARETVKRGDRKQRLIDFMRQNWNEVLGSNAEWVGIVASYKLGIKFSQQEIGDAFGEIERGLRPAPLTDDELNIRQLALELMPSAHELYEEVKPKPETARQRRARERNK